MTTTAGQHRAPASAQAAQPGWLERLGRAEARHARTIALAWVVAVGLAFAVALGALGGGSLFDRLSSGEPSVPGETQTGQRLLQQHVTTGERVLMMLDGVDPASPQVRERVQRVTQQLAAVPGVQSVISPYSAPAGSPQSQALLAPDGLLMISTLEPRVAGDVQRQALDRSAQLLGTADDGLAGATAHVGSIDQLVDEITHQVEIDLRTGEGIALPISLLVMVLVFGGFVAAGMPLAGAIASIGGALASLYGFSRLIELDATVVNVVTILGLGLCIDYGLLIVSRFREELHALEGSDDAGRRSAELALDGADFDAGRRNVEVTLGGADPDAGLRNVEVTLGGADPDAGRRNVDVTLGGADLDAGRRNVEVALGHETGRRSTALALGRTDPDAGRRNVEVALGRTVAHAGRTVLFSALIVGISLSGLLFLQPSILRALGAAGVSAVGVALLVALTFVPAMIGLAGHRLAEPGLPTRVPGLHALLARLGDVAPPVGVFSRLAARVQRRPWWVALAVVAVLLGLAAPALSLRMTSSGTELLPEGADQRTFFTQLDQRYPAIADPEVTVVARADLPRVQAWAGQVASVPGVASVAPPEQLDGLVVLGVHVDRDAAGRTATRVVQHLRSDRPDFPIWVLGQAAGEIDYGTAIAHRAPIAAGVVVLATFVLLFLMTGSVLVPLKALVMNVVSLGASLGVLVLIFQDGHLENLLGFTSTGAIESTIPPLVLAFGFGLAMDYEVFLLSRIKEEHDASGDNDLAVMRGLQRSGRIITSAALLVVIVFAGLIAGQLLVVKQTGVALAAAVAIDATLVRMLLVPATMTLLGEWNWWAPPPLRRLHARFGLEGH